MRAELYHQVGGFDPELSALQDYDLWIRLCMAAPVLYDGTHNLRFSAVSVSSERISQNVECYAAAFKYLRGKYRTQLEDLPLRQRRRFDAQAKLVEAGKYLQIRNYGSAAIRMAQAVALVSAEFRSAFSCCFSRAVEPNQCSPSCLVRQSILASLARQSSPG